MNKNLVVVIVLIFVIFLLYKNMKNKQESFIYSGNASNSNLKEETINEQETRKARYIRIDGSKNFILNEIELIDISGNNILKPLLFNDKKQKDIYDKQKDYIQPLLLNYNPKKYGYKHYIYKNIYNEDITITLNEGNVYKTPFKDPYRDDNIINDIINEDIRMGSYSNLYNIINGTNKETNFHRFFRGDGDKISILIDLGKEYQIKELIIYPKSGSIYQKGTNLYNESGLMSVNFFKDDGNSSVIGKIGDRLNVTQEIMKNKIGEEQLKKEINTFNFKLDGNEQPVPILFLF